MPDQEILILPIARLQPSQLFISRGKLQAVQESIKFTAPESIPPIPIKCLDGDLVITDGHTRSFAAYQAGLEEIHVYWDPDDLDWEAYRICRDWCKKAGIMTIADLKGRVVSSGEYEELWIQRCRNMHNRLASYRNKKLK